MLLRAVFTIVLAFVVAPTFAQDRPLPPADTPARITLPEGFRATLFAGEPDVAQPISFTFDDRGRMWVVECYSYPDWEEGIQDRVLIFEDKNGDGRFDTRKVFWDQGVNLSGIQLGFGGVWLCALPNLIFVPDRDGDDRPDGPPEVVLDGWNMHCRHNVFNGLDWGPDGWLYGLNGILATSLIGRPGIPQDERSAMNCGVWRYHPTEHIFEVVASGTTNPWGLDFDDYGEAFITNCVIAHLWHVVPGGHYKRMYGQDLNPHVYELIETCADHLHWAGGPWQSSRDAVGKHSDFGGGHAHAGAMVYLGDNWPDEYRGRVYTCNIHGNRVNQDLLKPHGSGYVASHAVDFLHVDDTWFRGLEVLYGPDGGVYVSDWNDSGECHDYDDVQRTTGRIYKITWGSPQPFRGDLSKLSDRELVELQLQKNDWYVRQSRRLLQERAASGRRLEEAAAGLWNMFNTHPDLTRKLRALWALHVIGELGKPELARLLVHPEDRIRGWAVRLLCEDGDVPFERFVALAKDDPSPRVRLALASGLQRVEPEYRWDIAAALATHAEDAGDLNIPLMLWYAVEPLVGDDPERAVALIPHARIPIVRRHISRRIAQGVEDAERLAPLVELLAQLEDDEVRLDVLQGMHVALLGRSNVPMPAGWQQLYPRLAARPDTDAREAALMLALIFGDREAMQSLRETARNVAAPVEQRTNAIAALQQVRDRELPTLLKSLLDDKAVRGAVLRSLAAYEDADVPALIVRSYPSLTEPEKRDAVNTLASRPAFALALLNAIEAGRIPSRDVSAYTVRQLMALNNQDLTRTLERVFGAIRPTSEDKAQRIAEYKGLLTPADLEEADLSRGRLLYTKTCASCHKLFGEGTEIGPDLTGSQRANLDYILENMLDPSAVVARDYQMTILQTEDGRVLTGIVRDENDQTLTLQTPTEQVIVSKGDIEARQQSPLSLMPEGQLEKLTPEEIRDLVAYLASPVQVDLPEGSETEAATP